MCRIELRDQRLGMNPDHPADAADVAAGIDVASAQPKSSDSIAVIRVARMRVSAATSSTDSPRVRRALESVSPTVTEPAFIDSWIKSPF